MRYFISHMHVLIQGKFTENSTSVNPLIISLQCKIIRDIYKDRVQQTIFFSFHFYSCTMTYNPVNNNISYYLTPPPPPMSHSQHQQSQGIHASAPPYFPEGSVFILIPMICCHWLFSIPLLIFLIVCSWENLFSLCPFPEWFHSEWYL